MFSLECIVYISIKIMNKCIDNEIFLEKFLVSKGIWRICSVPHSLVSASFSYGILVKLSKNRYLIKENNGTINIMINYAIKSYPKYESYEPCQFILNIIDYPHSYNIFSEEFDGVRNLF
ncbi:hypothetical protein HZS_1940, partial [Henneguya salminicola]